MKASYVVAASVLAGTALGVAVGWADFRHAPEQLFPGPIQRTADADGVPQVAIDDTDYDFGYVEGGSIASHTFHFTNVGTGTLTLKAGVTTCSSCTIANLSRSRVSPGESAEVVVEFAVRTSKRDFRHTAYVLTNDPKQRRVELNISGKVSTRFSHEPNELVFSRVAASETATAQLNVYSSTSDDLRVEDPKFGTKQTAEFFEARVEPIPAAELREGAKSGRRVLVTLKPGLPLGPFRQTILLTLRSGDGTKPAPLEVGIKGQVAGDLTVMGPGWRADTGVLTIGRVKAGDGATRNLTVLAKGDNRDDLELEPIEVSPRWLQVTVGKSSKLNDAVNQIPLTVKIPPDQPPAIYNGSDQGDYARILLGVKNRPDQEVRMYVRFVIGKDGS